MKKIFVVISLLVLACVAACYADTTGNPHRREHGMGFRKPNALEKKFIEKKVFKVTRVAPNAVALSRAKRAPGKSISLAASATNSQYLPPVGDQGMLGSCAAWASCYYVKTFQEAREHSWTNPDPAANPERVMSPTFGYNLANDGINGGSYPPVIMQIMCDHGCASLRDMPVIPADYVSWPTENAWRNAIPYRGDTTSIIDLSTNSGIDALKQVIANGDIAVIGVEIYENFDYYPSTSTGGIDSDVLYDNAGIDEGGHALTVIGYDDAKAYTDSSGPQTGAFLVANSWGTSWGIIPGGGLTTKGFMWISYTYLRDNSTYQEAYTISDRTAYTPTLIGKFGLYHQFRGSLYVSFLQGADRDHPDWTFDALPNLGGAHPINDRVDVDLSLLPINTGNRFWLRVNDAGSGTSGQVTYMGIERIGSGEAASSDAPANTTSGSTIYLGLLFQIMNNSLDHILTYPNPFHIRKGGVLRFAGIPLGATNVTVSIYNVAGELIRVLKEGKDIQTLPDSKLALWDGKNDSGNDVASGVYVWLAKCEGRKATGRVALIR